MQIPFLKEVLLHITSLSFLKRRSLRPPLTRSMQILLPDRWLTVPFFQQRQAFNGVLQLDTGKFQRINETLFVVTFRALRVQYVSYTKAGVDVSGTVGMLRQEGVVKFGQGRGRREKTECRIHDLGCFLR